MDRQIGMGPFVIDWAKEEMKIAELVGNIYVCC